ncbi:hypothetical protein J2Y69_000115 [Microbacterium resistens]|uniref:Uncharacterized protein n=1 Tax=Microbacterium resistens TaxID=156977 RepID=A0ABU1S8G0_9MICO|nr:hypothetical protein [Microbacterium resistens]MDR6865533.1 hypothetical protein [Microbacterium resistens]
MIPGTSLPFLFISLLIYVVIAALAGTVIYLAVRLAVQHALRSHDRWVEQGRPRR